MATVDVSRRRAMALLGAGTALWAAWPRALWAAEGDEPMQLVQRLYDALLGVMQEGTALGFQGRYDRLAPVIAGVYDLPGMTRLAVGPTWVELDAATQGRLVEAFTRMTLSTYAARFEAFNGEKLEVLDTRPLSNGTVMVNSRIVKSDGEPVELNYVTRQGQAGWRIVDVYLTGTISELATRRAEFGSLIAQGGAEALIEALAKKSAALAQS